MVKVRQVNLRGCSIATVAQQSVQQSRNPKVLDQLKEALRSRHYNRRTEQTYCHWVKRFIYFHPIRHPADMSEPGINAFIPLQPISWKMVMIYERSYWDTKMSRQR